MSVRIILGAAYPEALYYEDDATGGNSQENFSISPTQANSQSQKAGQSKWETKRIAMVNAGSCNTLIPPCLKNGTVTRPIAHLPLPLHNNEKKVHSKHRFTPLKHEYRKHIKPNIIRSTERLDMREALNRRIGDWMLHGLIVKGQIVN